MVRAGKTVQINASIPKDLMERLKALAERERRSLSNLVAYLLEKEVERLERQDE
jgi:predicted DNA-binding protein